MAAKLFHEDYKKQKAPFWSVTVKIQGNNFFDFSVLEEFYVRRGMG